MKNVHLLPTDKPSILSDCENYKHIYITSDEDIKEGDWVIAIEGIWKNTITKITGTPITDVWMKIILTTDPDLIGVQSIDDEFLEWFVKNPNCEYVEFENEKVHVGWEPDYSYEHLGIDGSKNVYHNFYKIIIPKEEPKQELPQLGTKEFNDLASAYFGGEPKQETLEEAAEIEKVAMDKLKSKWPHLYTFGYPQRPFPTNYENDLNNIKAGLYEGAKWQEQRMYSKEEVLNILYKRESELNTYNSIFDYQDGKEWFEQFKKK